MYPALQADCLLAEPQPAMRETWVPSLGQRNPLDREMAAHSSILSWRIPWMEKPGGLQSLGSQRLGDALIHQFSSVALSRPTPFDPMD